MNHFKILKGVLIGLMLATAGSAVLAEGGDPEHTVTPKDFKKGKQVYQTACAQCHDTGENEAPRLKDAKAWKNRFVEWAPVMEKHAQSGYLKMPAMGRHPLLSDQEIADAVFYMTETIKGRKK